ncbi:hypothetical protein ACFY78_18315 [Streptomyces olindensis]|uniref:hypothetical protein n=1 Tax=Streptomyces olindensis TaxID=358823 RepID=UPI00367D7CF8
MWIRRAGACLAAVGLCLGAVAGGASAASGPVAGERATAAGERATAPVSAQSKWWRSGYYAIPQRCDEDREAKQRRGVPTNPTSGCFRNEHGYYFLWWGSFWD